MTVKKTLVLLHGWGAGGEVWQKQAAALGESFTVLTPAVPYWEPGWLRFYLAGLALEECLVVGWSLGGMQLLEALAELQAEPKALALAGVAAVFCTRPDHPWGQPPAMVRAMRRGLRGGAPRVLRDFARTCLAPGEASYEAEVLPLFPAAAAPEHLAAGLDYLAGADLRSCLPRLSCPVALIQGEADRIVFPDQARYLARQWPGAGLHLLPDAGHVPFWTQAEVFNGILADLAKQI